LKPPSLLQHEMLPNVAWGSKGEILAASRCFPLFSRQQTFAAAHPGMLEATA
jgi:hypothetical protein